MGPITNNSPATGEPYCELLHEASRTLESHYKETLEFMEMIFIGLETQVPKPVQVPVSGGFYFRYKEKSIHQAIVQKLARIISGLYAACILLEKGFIQEQAALQRMLDEFQEDVTYLSYAIIANEKTEWHHKYLKAFYEEEFDKPEDPVSSTQKRPMVPRKKIHAYIAKIRGKGLDPSRGVGLIRTISKMYSGFIHGASPHIMDMYWGSPPRFHVSGMRETPLFASHEQDLWNYFYRGLCSFSIAAKAFGEETLVLRVEQYRKNFAERSGKSYEV